MKKILILLATICCCGCGSVETKATSTTEITKIKYYRNDVGGHIYSIEVEGHLYIAFGSSPGGGIIHAEPTATMAARGERLLCLSVL